MTQNNVNSIVMQVGFVAVAVDPGAFFFTTVATIPLYPVELIQFATTLPKLAPIRIANSLFAL